MVVDAVLEMTHELEALGQSFGDGDLILPGLFEGHSALPGFFNIVEEPPSPEPSSAVKLNVRPKVLRSTSDGHVPGQQKGGKLEEEQHYPSSWSLALLMTGICFAVFVSSADRTIMATAIPTISDEFHSYSKLGWYGSSYFLTSAALQPLFGRCFQLFKIKWIYVGCLVVSLLGSVVCGSAQSSIAFIIGRAITGIGRAGILNGSFVILAQSLPLQMRPLYTSALGVFYSFGTIAGPLLGGLFTSGVTFRWCFWLNVLLEGSTLVCVLFFFKTKERPVLDYHTLRKKITDLDILGTILLLVSAILLLLAFQNTSEGVSWGAASVIGLLLGALLTLLLFVGWTFWRGDRALVPPSIILQRTVAFACANAFFLSSAFFVQIYYLSIWFQAVHDTSALVAGVNLLPYLVPTALATILAGLVTSKSGYFAPPAWTGCAIGLVGSGLLTTLAVDGESGLWIAYLLITGAGFGLAMQQGLTAIHTVLPNNDVPIGIATVMLSQTLGGALSLSIGNTILLERLHRAQIPGVDISRVLSAGATAFKRLVPPTSLPILLTAYNQSLRSVFIAATVLASLAFLTSLGLGMRRVGGRAPIAGEESAGHRAETEMDMELEKSPARSDGDVFLDADSLSGVKAHIADMDLTTPGMRWTVDGRGRWRPASR